VVFDETRPAVVLDDPVTSLDHECRKYVARRLVELATDRQVVIFTHDLTFVGELAKAAELSGTIMTERTVERRPDGIPGVCVDNHPWKARDVAARLSDGKTELARIKRECSTW
jgi:ABC-type nitrate/sulfonate/bicarbonate transport system ATPase subunit